MNIWTPEEQEHIRQLLEKAAAFARRNETLRQEEACANHICYRCNRPLQLTAIVEVTGLCDHCREVTTLERTSLANGEYRAKTGEMLRDRINRATEPEAKQSLRARLARLMAEDPDGCECPVCVRNWEEHG